MRCAACIAKKKRNTKGGARQEMTRTVGTRKKANLDQPINITNKQITNQQTTQRNNQSVQQTTTRPTNQPTNRRTNQQFN